MLEEGAPCAYLEPAFLEGVAHFDKNELNEWISIINQKEGESCIKIIEVFWNMPENYYSILY